MAGTIDPKKFIPDIQKLNKEIGNLTEKLSLANKEMLKMSNITSQGSQSQKSVIANTNKLKTSVNDLSKSEIEIQKIQQKSIDLQSKIIAERSHENKILETLKQKRNENNKRLREQVKLEKANLMSSKTLGNSYKEISTNLSANILKYKNLSQEQLKNKKIGGQLEKTIKKQQAALKKMDANIGVFGRNVGNYRSALTGLLSAFGFVGGLALFAKEVKGAAKIMADFEESMSEVKAITGSTDDEILKLEKDALRLGRSTSRTAKQVSELQIEFAKLGFSTQEILNATEATLKLSIAARVDLAEAATVAGSTVRAFGLTTAETQRVVDVMAASFTTSALNMEKFKVAMAIVAPVAKNAGLSIEETTAMLAKLVDNGLDASTAGTGLRNVFLELTKKGLTLEQGLERIQQSTNKNATSLELFGKRGATIGTILAENTEQVKELTIAYDNANGAATEMADTMEDNLQGDIKELKSAWEGFILSFSTGSSELMRNIRTIVKGFTAMITAVRRLGMRREDILREKTLEKAKENVNEYVKSLRNEGKESKELIGLIEDQNDRYREEIKLLESGLGESRKKDRQIQENVALLVNQILLLNDVVDAEKLRIDQEIKIASAVEKTNQSLKKRVSLQGLQRMEGRGVSSVSRTSERTPVEGLMDIDRIILNEKKKLLEGQISYDQFSENVLKAYINDLQTRLNEEEAFTDESLRLEQELTDKKIELKELLEDIDKKNHENELKRIEERAMLISDMGQEVFDLMSQFREAERIEAENQFNAENERIEAKAAKELKAVGDNAQAQERINEWLTDQKAANEKELERKQKKIQRKQAIADKIAALFNAGITLAEGILKYSSNPVTLPLVPIFTTIGTAQIAAIAATPIPKFAKGLEDSPKDIIGTVGEAGREIVEMPGGQRYLAEKEMTMFLPKGSSVIPNLETERIIQGGIEPKKFDELIKATKQSKNGRVEDTGYLYKVERKNLRQKRLDKYYKGI